MTQTKTPPPRLAEEIAVECKLSAEAAALLQKGESWLAFFNRLVGHQRHEDAFRLAAYAFPKPQAIWWGALCLWNASRPTPPPEVDAILKAIVTWLKEPSEGHRRAVEKTGNAIKFAQPAGALALAVFASGGSISLEGLPHVEPAPGLTAKSVALAVGLLARKPGDKAARMAGFAALAGDVASGKIPYGLPAPTHAASREKPTAAGDDSVGRGGFDESIGAASLGHAPPAKPARAPVPQADADDEWDSLPRTSSSGQKRPAAKPTPNDDESIGRSDEF